MKQMGQKIILIKLRWLCQENSCLIEGCGGKHHDELNQQNSDFIIDRDGVAIQANDNYV